jgi:hypothetical protein
MYCMPIILKVQIVHIILGVYIVFYVHNILIMYYVPYVYMITEKAIVFKKNREDFFYFNIKKPRYLKVFIFLFMRRT